MRVQIRYNTQSRDENDRWRVNIDGKEILCRKVIIWPQVRGETTERKIETGETKYELTFYPNKLEQENGCISLL